MLTVHHLSKSFGIETVLEEVTFSVSRSERLGLVGPNGCGKTTLLRILVGLDQPDSGNIQVTQPNIRLGYLSQGFEFTPGETLGSLLNRMEGDLPALTGRLEQLATALMRSPNQSGLQREYDETLASLERASESIGRGPGVLAALGLGYLPLSTPTAHLSGGQKTRLALAGVLLSNPQLLLLDEPTNHLDLNMLEWLEDWLVGFPNAAIIVSHDRAFLDHTVTGILEIDPLSHNLRQYAGNYTAYLEQKLAEREHQWQEFKVQQDEITRLRSAAAHVREDARFKRGGKGDSGDKFAKGFFANRTRGTIRRAKHLEQRLEYLLSEGRIEKPRQSWQIKLNFGETPSSGRDILSLENLSIGYGDHILLSGLNLYIRQGERVALLGPNGSGKTTLMRTITGTLLPLEGCVQLGANVRIGYMTQEQEELDPTLDSYHTIRQFGAFSETEARTFLHQFLFTGDDVFIPVGSLSFGERSRLSLACLVAQGCNLLLLDEPINHLDIPSRTRFEQALANFEGTVLAIVHDRFFLDGFATEIWEIQDGSLHTYIVDPLES